MEGETLKQVNHGSPAGDELREREQFYAALMDRSYDGLTIIQDTLLVYANQRLADMFGYPLEEILNTPYTRYIYPDDLPQVMEYYTRRMAGEQVADLYESAILTGDGRRLEVEVNAGVISYQGRPADFVYVRDISQRKQAEIALRRSDEELRALVQNLSDLIFVIDEQACIKFETPSVSQTLGYPPGYLIGKKGTDLIHPDDQERVKADLEEVLTRTNPFMPTEFRLRSADGNWIMIEAVGNNLLDHPAVQGVVITGREVTTRKKNELELKRLKEFNERIVQSMVEGILIQDKDGYYTFSNPAACTILGYEPGEIEGKHWKDITPPDYHSVLAAAIDRRKDGFSDSYETQMLRKDGGHIITWISGNPIFDQDGYAGAVAVFADITGLKTTELRIRRLLDQQITVNRLALTLGNLTDLEDIYTTTAELVQDLVPADVFIVALYDHDKKLIRAGYISAYGEQFPAGQFPNIEYGDDHHSVFRQVLEDGLPVFLGDHQLRTDAFDRAFSAAPEMSPDHQRLLKLIQANSKSSLAVPMKVGGETQGVLLVQSREQDVYDREDIDLLSALGNMAAIAVQNALLLEQARQQSQAIQQIIDTVPEGVLLLDPEHRILLANPIAQVFLQALSGSDVGERLTTLGDNQLDELLVSPRSGIWHEVSSAGRIFETAARPIESGPSRGGWVVVVREVTRQREAERRIQQQERLATVGQLAAGIAHDFNNIMSTIVLYAQMSTQSPWIPARDREHISTIYQQAMQATELIRQILDFSRRSVLERQPISLRPLLKEQVRLFERTLGEDIIIELVGMRERCLVFADPTRMQQVLLNLALNGRDAMPGGGVLQIGLDQIEIKEGDKSLLPEMPAGRWVRLTVTDSGNGIEPEHLPHIFEPFYTTKSPGEGTGLGLAQVYGIVSQHDGFIDVQSTPGSGSTFTIYLPALQENLTGIPDLDTGPLLKGHEETILVVEDSVFTRQALVDSLELLNYHVLTASNGRMALDVLTRQTKTINLVISDVIMPEMSGLALVREMVDNRIDVPVVLLTGHTLGKDLENLRAEGRVELLPKPPSLEQIGEVVARMVRKTGGS